jgi:hypothetical protein
MVHPNNNWNFHDDAEDAFVEWFNGFYSPYTFRSEWFFGDAEIGDVNTRKDVLYGWVHSAFVAGWEASNYAKLEEQTGLTEND